MASKRRKKRKSNPPEFQILDGVTILLRGPVGQEREARRQLADVLYNGRASAYAPRGMDWEGLYECEYLDDSGTAEVVATLIAGSALVDYQIRPATEAKAKIRPPKYKRLTDRRGRYFYIPVGGGKRVSVTKWKEDLQQRKKDIQQQTDVRSTIEISIIQLDVVYHQSGHTYWWCNVRYDRVAGSHAGDPYA